MLKEFRDFAVKGNVLDLAIGVILGGAFGKIVSSFVSDVLMPPIGLLLGKVDFANLYVNLSGGEFASLAEAKKAGAATINYGLFVNSMIDFAIVAFSIFMVVRMITKMKQAPAPVAPSVKPCPQCLMEIPLAAKRCGHCTSAV